MKKPSFLKHKILVIAMIAMTLGACDKSTPANTQSAADNLKSTAAENTAVESKATTQPTKPAELQKSAQLADMAALRTAIKKTNVKPDSGIKWQMRLAQAKNEQEAKAILTEVIQDSTQMLDELQKVKLTSPEVIAIQQQLIEGTQITLNALKQFLAMDLNDPNIEQKMTPINNEIVKGSQITLKASEEFIGLMQSLGLNTDKETMQYYEHYKGQMEQFKQNQ